MPRAKWRRDWLVCGTTAIQWSLPRWLSKREFVDAQGTLWKGTRETGQGFVDLHARDCKGSKIASAASDILSVSYDVVVLRIDWQLAGAKGSEHRRLHWMLVLAQFGGIWEIVAAQSLIVRS